MTDNNDEVALFSSDNEDFQHFLETYVELLEKYEQRCLDLLEESNQAANEFVNEAKQSPIWKMLQDILQEQQSNSDSSLQVDMQQFSERLKSTLMEQWNVRGMPRIRRENLSKEKVMRLKEWFDTHIQHPYPTESEKQQLCQETGMQMQQITNWFINQRKRGWRKTDVNKEGWQRGETNK
ncbi:Homeobox protein knotted-1-like 8 [Galdieria sulphuraria]|uniref:Transcription factor n=1 Tax=Galdieria sulphuraria TaxID=130081 RepID=M2X2M4_GALSU|nr:transcription factor [Galdieria sulphuraria]EME30635.1 transcription factor [Galdieria sulphuraria]GJD09032.1 Homeobox protein knotted-1-like 8 [Galdieria sulphuraria]|eukprot:XP_005707155.1 transcription factor [Galdieria sulphuraria]